MVLAPLLSLFVSQKLSTLAVKHNSADLIVLKDLVEAKVTPLIGRTHPLNEVPEAIRDQEKGHAQG